ncbi:hypothetical protein ACFL0W_04260 [Nanoarchaeota archaeon]
MAWEILKPKKDKEITKIHEISIRVADAFNKVKGDIIDLKYQHGSMEEDAEKIKQWITYLYKQQQNIHNSHGNVSRKVSNLDAQASKLHDLHSSTAKEVEKTKHETATSHQLTAKELHNLREWIKHFSNSIEAQKSKEDTLRKEIAEIQTLHNDSLKTYESEITSLKKQNTRLHEKLDELEQKLNEQKAPPVIIEREAPIAAEQKPAVSREPEQSGFERQILARVRPNRKNFVMNEILELINQNKHSTGEIEDIIIKQKNLCGRTSFYAYLRELKNLGKIDYADANGKSFLVALKETD